MDTVDRGYQITISQQLQNSGLCRKFRGTKKEFFEDYYQSMSMSMPLSSMNIYTTPMSTRELGDGQETGRRLGAQKAYVLVI